MLGLMCIDTVHVLMRQCEREYGLAAGDLCGENGRQTQLYLLSTEELIQLPSNNISAEWHHTAFGWRSTVANLANNNEKHTQKLLKTCSSWERGSSDKYRRNTTIFKD